MITDVNAPEVSAILATLTVAVPLAAGYRYSAVTRTEGGEVYLTVYDGASYLSYVEEPVSDLEAFVACVRADVVCRA